MKLRIHGNSIRLRLSQSEVAEFQSTGRVDSRLEMPGGSLGYSLVADPSATILSAEMNGAMIVRVPSDEAERWAASDEVGISAEQPVGDGTTLKILIEKDFTCLVPRAGEDDADTFPHPRAASALQ